MDHTQAPKRGHRSFLRARTKHKCSSDSLHGPCTYKVGSKVLISYSYRNNKKGNKIAFRWTGPFTVEEIYPKGMYKVTDKETPISASRLKPYKALKKKTAKNLTCEHYVDKYGTGMDGDSDSADSVVICAEEKVATTEFKPVDKEWQESRASTFGFSVRCYLPSSKPHTISVTEPPKEKVSMNADGNCLFRSFSYFLTGSQTSHKRLRHLIVKYMRINTSIFSNLAESPNYPDGSNMDCIGEWGTEVEIVAFASLVATSIAVYGCSGRDESGATIYKWLTYTPNKDLQSAAGLPTSTKIMYLTNTDMHFEPVLEV
ncbi:uncharacterized protein [Panulirus ornatus]|uniref:uncharacterized protein n=1 Tax=Panulirus ornatus TaxID=150431 RepID=UPI003A885BD8